MGGEAVRASFLIFSMLFIACCPSLADQDQRFVEFPFYGGKTRIYDLRTVQTIQPGRFTIISTVIDDGDLMTLELKVLDTLRTYCTRPDGKYPPPTTLFTSGQPDLPITNIEVKRYKDNQSKTASWQYPYKRFAVEHLGEFITEDALLICKEGSRDEWELFREQKKSITDGERHKEVFDCRRALWGYFPSENVDAGQIQLNKVSPDTNGDLVYRDICLKVTHETPYQSE
jgi:hypothetical protein